jgi:hypothetical protein
MRKSKASQKPFFRNLLANRITSLLKNDSFIKELRSSGKFLRDRWLDIIPDIAA